MKYDVKRCPCCGEEAELGLVFINRGILGHTQEYVVYCRGCELQTKKYATPEAAQLAWNKRYKE